VMDQVPYNTTGSVK